MLRRDAQLAARERHLHAAFTALAEDRAARLSRAPDAAVPYGDLSLVQVFNAERVPEGAGQLLELEDFARVGLLVNAMSDSMPRCRRLAGDGSIAASMNSSMSDARCFARCA